MMEARQHFLYLSLTARLKIAAFISVEDWFEAYVQELVCCPLSRDAGELSSCGAGVEHAVSSCSTLAARRVTARRLRLKSRSSGSSSPRRPNPGGRMRFSDS